MMPELAIGPFHQVSSVRYKWTRITSTVSDCFCTFMRQELPCRLTSLTEFAILCSCKLKLTIGTWKYRVNMQHIHYTLNHKFVSSFIIYVIHCILYTCIVKVFKSIYFEKYK